MLKSFIRSKINLFIVFFIKFMHQTNYSNECALILYNR